jgi:hypothetical protein
MTFGEIYTKVAYLIWGDSTPPAGATTMLTGDEGIIANTHRRIMSDYNYWFMQTYMTGTTTAGVNSYAMASNYKEIISVQFKTEGDGYFQPPCQPLTLGQAQIQQWTNLESTADYPFYYEIVSNDIVFYPTPAQTDYDFHIMYWRYLDGPTSAFVDGTSTESSSITVYSGDAVAYLAAADMLQIMDEFQKADIYKTKGYECIETLRQEDRSRRQNHISTMHSDVI